MPVYSLAFGFLGGIFGWAVTTFIAQPFAAVMSARSEAAHVLAQFEPYDDFNPSDDSQTPPSESIIADRVKAYTNCGAKLVAFDLSYQPLARILRVRLVNWRTRSAGDALIFLAQLNPGNRLIDDYRQNALRALRLGRRLGKRGNIRV